MFNDAHLAADHPEYVISDLDGTPLKISSMYWPSAYNRTVWQYKTELALEAAALGFNEIQFDYIRFPDGAYKYEKAGTIDYRNTYGESKAQAVQRFLLYAAERLHKAGYYISGDVFGECANAYVTACGQYWLPSAPWWTPSPACPTPTITAHRGTISPGSTLPTVYNFGESAMARQSETASPPPCGRGSSATTPSGSRTTTTARRSWATSTCPAGRRVHRRLHDVERRVRHRQIRGGHFPP